MTTSMYPSDKDNESTSTSSASASAAQGSRRRRVVAVIGGGVTGLAAAWHLHTQVNNDNDSNDNNGIEVHLYEAQDRLGGHAYTVQVNENDTKNDTKNNNVQDTCAVVDVDIGFMVYNHENYPNLVRWFQALGVTEQDSDMSLSVSLDHGKTVEWNSDGLPGLFAKPSAATSPAFYAFVRDLLRFHRKAPQLLQLHEQDPRKHVTTQEYLTTHGYSQAFAHYYLWPMMAALWSASMEQVLDFPAAQLIAFLCHHKMLQVFQRPVWKTVAGRSKQYTTKMEKILQQQQQKQQHAHVNTPIDKVERTHHGKYQLTTRHGTIVEQGPFDDVIFACHAPTAQAILAKGNSIIDNKDKDKEEEEDDTQDDLHTLLGQIQYADNVVYVHSDPALMPQRKRAWASWNCLGQSRYMPKMRGSSTGSGSSSGQASESMEGGESGFGNKLVTDDTTTTTTTTTTASDNDNNTTVMEGPQGRMKAVYVTYWLNRLQKLDTEQNIFVSLNPHQAPAAHLTHHRVILAHPQFTPATIQARQKLEALHQGVNGLWFCGAWQGYGFHEDGCRAGFAVATKLSQTPLPWAPSAAQPFLAPPDLAKANHHHHHHHTSLSVWNLGSSLYRFWTYKVPVALCRRFVLGFLSNAVRHGQLVLEHNDGSRIVLGDGTPCGCGDHQAVTLRIFDPWFYVKVATQYDLGLARSYMAGHFVVQPLDDVKAYHPVLRPPNARNETATTVLGDPIGLTRLFLLLIGNRDTSTQHLPRKAAQGHWYNNALTNASGLVISKIGSFLNYVRYKLTMDNSERGGSLKNIHAHYDLSNDLFRTFLDKETLMYSSAIYDAVRAPSPLDGLVFRGTLEQAQWRKLDTLLARAQVQPGQKLLDIGFGWGGLSLHAAKKYGCQVTGITLSVEQKALAEERVNQQGLQDLITFEVIDYRTFARQKRNLGQFDRVLSCEMIEAVGHEHLGEFFWAVEQVLAPNGILVMEAITTPEQRYETYLRSTDFINTIIFPGSCCPSLHALVDAAYRQSCLTLEHVDNIGLHYAQTLAEWRRRFNANEATVRKLGFDDVFLRAWNYYLTYCEAGFFSQTENCLILVFSRQGCSSLVPLCETRCVTQPVPLTNEEVQNWLSES